MIFGAGAEQFATIVLVGLCIFGVGGFFLLRSWTERIEGEIKDAERRHRAEKKRGRSKSKGKKT
jgi:hypothetical protein